MWVMSLSCKYDYIRNNEKPVLKLENLSLLELSIYNGKFCINICIVCRYIYIHIYLCQMLAFNIISKRNNSHIYTLCKTLYLKRGFCFTGQQLTQIK